MAHGGGGPAYGIPPGVRPLAEGDPVVIGPYTLLGRLGVGGMGVVYLAERPGGGMVALKTPHPSHLHDATLRARFVEEITFSRRVVPFCTAAVIEDGADRGRPYLVSEYVPGPALSEVIAAGGLLPAGLAYGVALGVAAALVAVHEAGLVHRDLKPGNVLLSEAGPRLIDFGIAQDVDALVAHTQAGHVMGSPGWVAPERLTGGAALPASDVFSWGCVVAYAATGRHPFGAGDVDALSRRVLLEPPDVSSVPAPLRPAVEAALAKDPALRPRAADLLGALLAAGGVGDSPGLDPLDPRRAVADVLARAWRPMPYARRGGRTSPVTPAGPERSGRPAGPLRGAPPRGNALLSRVRFAVLAAVAVAAVAVGAAARGGTGEDAGPGVLGRVPVVMPARESTARATAGVLSPGGGRRGAPPAAPTGTPVAGRRDAVRTVSGSPVNGESREGRPSRGRRSAGPSAEGERRGCASAVAGRGRACPKLPGDPGPFLPRPPQAGEQEEDDPGALPSPSPAVTAPVPQFSQEASPSAQPGG
ncbi:protein kinase [Streptosporangium violaceochromogenes]|nr:protein kinase [Streptosporangium violaceochromogenes]